MFSVLEGIDYDKMKPKPIDKKEFKKLLIKIQNGEHTEREYEFFGNQLPHIFINISYRYNFKGYPTYLKQDAYILFIQNWFLYGMKNYNQMGDAFSYVTQYVFNAFIHNIKLYNKSIGEMYNYGYIEEKHDRDNIDNFYEEELKLYYNEEENIKPLDFGE